MICKRKPHRLDRLVGLGALTATLFLAACGGGADSGTAAADGLESAAARTTVSAAVAQPSNTEGRLLASNCFQCHGTLGTGGFDGIRGSEAREVLEFASKAASSDIMAAHAQGYTPAQLQKIIAYLQQ